MDSNRKKKFIKATICLVSHVQYKIYVAKFANRDTSICKICVLYSQHYSSNRGPWVHDEIAHKPRN